MDRLQNLEVFALVAENGSFTKAASALKLSPAMVSIRISQLEDHLGVRLFHRNSRSTVLTVEGSILYAQCRLIFAEVDKMEALVSKTRRSPHGRLRVDISTALGKHLLLPHLEQFSEQYPEITLEIRSSEDAQFSDKDESDVAVRYDPFKDKTPSLIARRIGYVRSVIVASPQYLAKFGVPTHPKDMQRHNFLHYLSQRTTRNYGGAFKRGDKYAMTALPGRLAFSETDLRIDAAMRGLGLIQCLTLDVGEQIRAGKLKIVLDEFMPTSSPVWLLYPRQRQQTSKIRAFTTFLAQLYSPGNKLLDPLADHRQEDWFAH